MSQTVTRFAPSPSGYLHIGGARTALFSWLYARHMKGRFVLRIEDTDAVRSTRESVDAIFEALNWLGMAWDEGPFFQSERFHLYEAFLKKLIDSGQAYYCTCSSEKVELMRKRAMEAGGKPKYDGSCREKGLSKSKDSVIRFKSPLLGATVLEDVVKGRIVFQNQEMDDFIIQRSDGMPTYNFAVVVDDITMGINTVLRGDDHVMNTPKQILLYKALDSPLPTFGHVPMVLGHDRTRLSKRHGAMSVTAYRDMGYLPQAVLNYLVRLGWSYGDQEFFTVDELISKFDIKNLGRSAGVFNPEKLLALNAEHIKATPPEKLAPHLLPFLKQRGYPAEKGQYLNNVIATLKLRSKTLVEMAESASFYYVDKPDYDSKAVKKFLKADIIEVLEMLADKLEQAEDLSVEIQEKAFGEVLETTGIKFGKVAQPVRVAITGKTVSPGIFEMIETLGKDRTILRLRAAIDLIKSPQGE